MKKQQLAKMFDHTILKATATPAEVESICKEAIEINAASVCVNPINVKQVASLLSGSDVKVCTVVGFPLGANTPAVKAFETRDAIAHGADEIDMVINVGALIAGDIDAVYNDIYAVVKAAEDAVVKVIIETCYLNDEQKELACNLAQKAGADFVKTSTGFGTAGATSADIALMRKTVGATMQVKASGGIRDYESAIAMVNAGADRLGVSASLDILVGAED